MENDEKKVFFGEVMKGFGNGLLALGTMLVNQVTGDTTKNVTTVAVVKKPEEKP